MKKLGKIRKNEELIQLRLIDISERCIKNQDFVDAFCFNCNNIFKVKYQYLRTQFFINGKNWNCKACINKIHSDNGKKLIGDKNPFYGKKHNKNTKLKMEKSSKTRWNNTSQEIKEEIGEQMRLAFTNKHGGINPMKIESIKKIHQISINNFFNDKKRVQERRDKIIKTNIERYGIEFTTQLVKTTLARNSLEAREKRRLTFQKIYGVDTFFESQEFKKMKEENDWSVSKIEAEILSFIKGLGLNCSKKIIEKTEIDIYIPDLKIGIEYNGLFHHSDYRNKNIYRHYNKMMYWLSMSLL